MITFSALHLQPALAGLSKVVSTKHALPELRCVKVSPSKESITLSGTDMDVFASVEIPTTHCSEEQSFLLPLDRLLAATKRLPTHSCLHLEPGSISTDLGTGRIGEKVNVPEASVFPAEPKCKADPVPMPETFATSFSLALQCSSTDVTRYILQGVALDASVEGSHYLIGTDAKHLFSANSFNLPVEESVTVPSHRVFNFRGLLEYPWAIAVEKTEEGHHFQLMAGPWKILCRTIDGKYPNWRQVIPKTEDHRTFVEWPEENNYAQMLAALPCSGTGEENVVDLLISSAGLTLHDPDSESSILLEGSRAKGQEMSVRVNRAYLAKAFAYGFKRLALIDELCPLHFMGEGTQLIVMPMRLTKHNESPPQTQPATAEPTNERKNTMPETNSNQINGARKPFNKGADRSFMPTSEKTAIEVAIEKLDTFKATFREALTSITETTSLLKQAIRDQKTGEKEIRQVRQTLRSLQGVKL